MRRAFLLLLWIVAVTPAMAEPAFQTHDDFSRWLTYYYMNPEPNRLPDAMQHMSKLKMLDSKSNFHSFAGFLSGIFRNNPDKVASRVEQLSSLQEQHVGVIILGLWYAALPESQQMAQALLEKHPKLKSDFGFIYTSAPMAIEQISLEQAPLVLDALWGKFAATGDSAPVERIISTLPWIDVRDQAARQLVGVTAKFGLTYHAAQHKRVFKICEDTAKTASAEVAIKLREVIDSAKKDFNKGLASQATAEHTESVLWDAVTNGDVGKAKTLIASGADVNYKNRYGYSVLHHAVSLGNAELVELLIAKGANVNAKAQFGMTSLHQAGKKGMAEILLAHGGEVDAQPDKGETPLHLAASGGISAADHEAMLNMAEVLIAHGADLNKVSSIYGTPLNKAAYYNKIQMAKLLIVHGADVEGKGASPLSSAGVNGDYVEMAQLLVESGAGVNTRAANGGYPLHAAASGGHSNVAMFLLARGANPNAITEQGFTALYLAAGSDYDAASAEALLSHGADPNARITNGRTALHQASSQGAKKVIAILLAHKADINAGDRAGYTPLYDAIRHGTGKGEIGVVEILVNNGANVNATNDRDGETPLHKAISRGDIDVVKLLIAHGADVNAVSKSRVTSLYFARNSKAITQLLQEQGAH